MTETEHERVRYEKRGGKTFKVTTIPEQKRRPRRKPMMTKAMANNIAVRGWPTPKGKRR